MNAFVNLNKFTVICQKRQYYTLVKAILGEINHPKSGSIYNLFFLRDI